MLLVHVALERPLGQDAAAGVREPVVDLVDGEMRLGDQRVLLVVVRVRVVLVLAQPREHRRHRLVGERGTDVNTHSHESITATAWWEREEPTSTHTATRASPPPPGGRERN